MRFAWAALLPLAALAGAQTSMPSPATSTGPAKAETPTPLPRFLEANPLPVAPTIMLDRESLFDGPARQVAAKFDLQARILWIDETANLDRTNSEEKIVPLVRKIKESGFNTVVLDVKPLSGEVLWPSAFAPKIREWRGKSLPAEFDPVAVFVRECKKQNLVLFASMNAFCEGHRLFGVGPGFLRPDEQSVVYEPSPIVAIGANRYAMGDAGVQAFPAVTAVPQGKPGSFTVTIRASGEVIDGFETMPNSPPPTLPKGGMALYGEGAAAEFLRAYAKPGERATADTEARFVRLPESTDKQMALMTQPSNPKVRERLLNLAKEFVSKYEVAGIIYDDRLRYTGINGDFSDSARAAFEAHLGKKINWPDDVFKFTNSFSGQRGLRPGPYYQQWLSWRPTVLKSFVQEVRRTIREVRPDAQVGVYAGSWYGEYSAIGNNWADPNFQQGFWFNDREYGESGMAPVLDLLITGCYYPTATIFEAMDEGRGIGANVEAAATLSKRATRDATWTIAGLSLADFKDDPDQLQRCLQAAVACSDGVMVFDLSHDIEPMWPVFAQAFSKYKIAPYSHTSFLDEVRRRRQAAPPNWPRTIVSGGAPGIGQ